MSVNIHDLGGRPVVIGGGIAGLMTALNLAPAPVVLLTKTPIGRDSSSALAQGGLAVSLAADDTPALHLADTLAAGDGLCDVEVVRRIVAAAPFAVATLIGLGVHFERTQDGRLSFGLEAAHSRRRIVHAGGGAAGQEIMRALEAAVRRTPSITVVEGMEARRIMMEEGAVAGLVAMRGCEPVLFSCSRIVIATGGIGGLFFDTTNPLSSFGQGLALAAHAGAEMADLEFVQFHPTALDGPLRPMRLISEAVRGEGAVLIDETGRQFMRHICGAELAPRDVVARATSTHLAKGHRVFIDARERPGATFACRFPAIEAFCKEAGFDPVRQPLPVRPAAHYHMGGIAVDAFGRSSLEGLWACGEAASTGLHGANRLASNALIEAAVSARWVAESLAGAPARRQRRPSALDVPPGADPAPVRPLISRALGLVRDGESLREAVAALLPLALAGGPASDPATLGLMMAIAALRRAESRGAHFRADFPERGVAARRSNLTLERTIAEASALAPAEFPIARSA